MSSSHISVYFQHESSNVLLNLKLLTFSARISHSFVFTFNMSHQNTCLSCGILTLRAMISHSFMFTFNMNLQSACCSFGVLKMRTRLSHSFVFLSTCLFKSLTFKSWIFYFNMILLDTYCSCSKITFITPLSMNLKITSLGCDILPFRARIPNFFMFTFNILELRQSRIEITNISFLTCVLLT